MNSVFVVLMALSMMFNFSGCGGGGTTGGTPQGPAPMVSYDPVTNVTDSQVELCARADTKSKPATVWNQIWTNDGWNFSTPVQNLTSNTEIPWTNNVVLPYPGKTYKRKAICNNGFQTETPTETFSSAATAVTGTEDNVSSTGANLSGTLSMVEAGVGYHEYGTDPTLATFAKTDNAAVVGMNQLVKQAITGQTPNTRIYWRSVGVVNGRTSKGQIKSFVTAPTGPNTVTVTGIFPYTNTIYVVILDDQVADRINGDVEPNFSRTYHNVHKVQFTADYDILNPARVSAVIYNSNNNNVFTFAGDGNINLGNGIISSIPGGSMRDITGVGFTDSREEARMINFTWADTWFITDSTAPPPEPQIGDNVTGPSTYIQDPTTPNIVQCTVSGFPTMKGCMNGKTLYGAGFWWPNNEFIVWGTLNAVGNRIDGWQYVSWIDSGSGQQVHISGPLEEIK